MARGIDDLYEEVEVVVPCPYCEGTGKVDTDEFVKTYDVDEHGFAYCDGTEPVRVRCEECRGTGIAVEYRYIPKGLT